MRYGRCFAARDKIYIDKENFTVGNKADLGLVIRCVISFIIVKQRFFSS